MKVKLYKVSSTHNNLRTNEMEGETAKLPAVGERFLITGESLTPGGIMRYIETTAIESLQQLSCGRLQFKTRNSSYLLEVLNEA